MPLGGNEAATPDTHGLCWATWPEADGLSTTGEQEAVAHVALHGWNQGATEGERGDVLGRAGGGGLLHVALIRSGAG